MTDNTQKTFLSQLTQEGTANYVGANLDTGDEWLTSRLFIMTILFAQLKGVEWFVFVETSGSLRKRYVGWSEPEKIRWALARCYT